MAITDRYGRLLKRRAPEDDRIFEKFAEDYERQQGDNTKYVLGAMRSVDARYTDRLTEQGNRIENQLSKRLSDDYPDMDFRRQGSVSNGTHIRYFSDVDVLTLIDWFITLEPPQTPRSPYAGEPVDDLEELRERCRLELQLAFPKTIVDDSGTSALTISGGSLACDVDVVPANWYDTNGYSQSGQEHDRGVQVLDREARQRIKNFPFLFNHRLGTQDLLRIGTTKMLIRLMKTIKADAVEEGRDVDFSSFDICSVVYRMPDSYATYQLQRPLDIVLNLLIWLKDVLSTDSHRETLQVVDDSRLIFDSDGKAGGLLTITTDLLEIYEGALGEQGGSILLTESHL